MSTLDEEVTCKNPVCTCPAAASEVYCCPQCQQEAPEQCTCDHEVCEDRDDERSH